MKTIHAKMKGKHKYLKAALLLICAFVCASNAYSQIVVTGSVRDAAGETMPGVSVVLKGDTGVGTFTETDGSYKITVPSQQSVLQFSFMGYDTQTITVGNRTFIVIVLSEKLRELDEVVVVGYGVQKRKHLTGAVAQVNSEELLKAPMSNINNMLAGKLPGLTVTQSSGLPGNDQASLTVRGYSTMNDASPLFIVDGVERMIQTVNPEDVESVTILKDAAAAAVYGVRAANGVVLITTKRGQDGKPKFSYSGSATFSLNTRFPKLLNGPDYVYWYNQALDLDKEVGRIEQSTYDLRYFDADAIAKIYNGYDPNGVYGNTDWYGELFKDYGLTHQHNISVTGGSQNVRYYTSAGFMNQDGIVDANVNYKRFNIRSNVDIDVTKDLSVSVNLAAFKEERLWPGIGLGSQVYMNPINQATFAAPIIPMEYNGMPVGWQGESPDEVHSPIASIRNSGFNTQDRKQFEGNALVTYKMPFLDGLKASLFFSYDDSHTENKSMLSTYDIMVYDFDKKEYNSKKATATGTGSVSKSASAGERYTIRPSIEYNQKFDKHNVGAMFLYERYRSHSTTMTAAKRTPIFDYPVDLNWATESNTTDPTGSFSNNARIGYVGRFNYAYDDKYLAEMSFRVDGTPKFAKAKRWGFFPSLSLGWVMSEENFFKEALPKVDYLKLRGSVGELGTDDTDPFLYMTTFSLTGSYAYAFGTGGSVKPYQGLYINRVIPSLLTWSKSRTYDVGFEMTMFRGMLGVEFDWFYTITRDILEPISSVYPPSLGGNYQSIDNTGKLDNRGFELILKHRNNIGNVHYNLTGSLAWARNKVLARSQSNSVPWARNQIGRPQGEIYGLNAIGLYQTQEQLDNRPIGPRGRQDLGDIMYEDVNNDGKIDSDDYVKIGRSSLPEMNYSFNMNVSYKNFDISALWQGAAICDIKLQSSYYSGVMDNTMFTRPFYQKGNAPYYLVEDAWTPENTDAAYPRLSTQWNANNGWTSSWWIRNGAYLRLKNAQFGYTVPESFLRKMGGGVSNLRIYIAGTNLLTFSEFKYVDPEMSAINNGYYPQQKTYSVGVNITF